MFCAGLFVGPWQMLEENARVARMIGEHLRDQTIRMGLHEMENLLNRCALVQAELAAAGTEAFNLPSPPSLHITGFEKLWWNLGRSTAGIRATRTSSTSTICWPPSATASSSSKMVAGVYRADVWDTQSVTLFGGGVIELVVPITAETPQSVCRSSSRPARRELSPGPLPTPWQLWTGP